MYRISLGSTSTSKLVMPPAQIFQYSSRKVLSAVEWGMQDNTRPSQLHFLTLLNIGRNAPKKNRNSNYILLYEKNAFRLNCAPTGKHAISLSCVFRLGHFPRSKLESESICLIKYYIITILNFFSERFVLYCKSQKNDFPLHFLFWRGRIQDCFFKLGS